MAFVRRKRGQVQLALSVRAGGGTPRQLVLHRFPSPGALQAVLASPAWEEWTAAMAWRHPGLRFDWRRVRTALETELAAWQGATTGAVPRGTRAAERLATRLETTLRKLAPATTASPAALAVLRPTLAKLHARLEQLLASGSPAQELTKGTAMNVTMPDAASKADEIFSQGMEHWWVGDRRKACRRYRQALELDPRHADAHNHLGIEAMERERLAEAEEHFRAAMEGGVRGMVQEDGHAEWGWIENRPYLRGLANLALLHRQRGEWREAVAIHEELLRLNPNDNQGVRYLLGEELQRIGDLDAAIRAGVRTNSEDPGSTFCLALALMAAGRPEGEVGRALLRGFAANRYVAPMLLGERWELLDGWHGSNLAEPQCAADYVEECADLWRSVPDSSLTLRTWWEAPAVRTWRAELDEVMVELEGLELGDRRSALVGRHFALMSTEHVRKLAAKVLRARKRANVAD